MALSRTTFTLALVLICGTAGNVWYNNRDRLRSPLSASTLAVGTDLSGVAFVAIPGDTTTSTKPIGAGACHLVVVYMSTCAHCHAAAARVAALPPSQRIPTTWVPVVADSLVGDFARTVAEGSAVRVVANAKSQFKVSAVPAAFLIGADDKVRAAFGYSGKEEKALLDAQCS